VEADITRPNAVSVRYLGEAGMIERRDFEGLEARSVQHQIDHLAGRMYFDNLGRVKRDMLLRRARKKR
jgi:peptide deformylase